MNPIKYAANGECPAATNRSRTPEANTKIQAATQHNIIVNGMLTDEPISPISLTV